MSQREFTYSYLFPSNIGVFKCSSGVSIHSKYLGIVCGMASRRLLHQVRASVGRFKHLGVAEELGVALGVGRGGWVDAGQSGRFVVQLADFEAAGAVRVDGLAVALGVQHGALW